MNCTATIGQVGNIDHDNVSIGKAGRTRHMGFRPTVRGSVMNPCDHPHGGGEGKSPIGRPGPVTPWGKPTLGYKTRKTKNRTDKLIVKTPQRQIRKGDTTHEQKRKEGPLRRTRAPQEGRGTERRQARRRSSRPGPAPPPSSRSLSVTPSPSTTAASMFRCMSPRTWSATSWANSPPPAPSAATPAAKTSQ